MTAKASLDDVRFHDPVRFRKFMEDSIAAMRRIPGVVDAAEWGPRGPHAVALQRRMVCSEL